jgi:hypothetical protein
MAVQLYTAVKIKGHGEKASMVTWSDLLTGNTGDPAENPTHADRSVQVAGTFGGATCTIQGSNNGSDWVTLTDPAGAALTFVATGLKQILQVTKYIRPNITGGAAAAIDVDLLIVRKS